MGSLDALKALLESQHSKIQEMSAACLANMISDQSEHGNVLVQVRQVTSDGRYLVENLKSGVWGVIRESSHALVNLYAPAIRLVRREHVSQDGVHLPSTDDVSPPPGESTSTSMPSTTTGFQVPPTRRDGDLDKRKRKDKKNGQGKEMAPNLAPISVIEQRAAAMASLRAKHRPIPSVRPRSLLTRAAAPTGLWALQEFSSRGEHVEIHILYLQTAPGRFGAVHFGAQARRRAEGYQAASLHQDSGSLDIRTGDDSHEELLFGKVVASRSKVEAPAARMGTSLPGAGMAMSAAGAGTEAKFMHAMLEPFVMGYFNWRTGDVTMQVEVFNEVGGGPGAGHGGRERCVGYFGSRDEWGAWGVLCHCLAGDRVPPAKSNRRVWRMYALI